MAIYPNIIVFQYWRFFGNLKSGAIKEVDCTWIHNYCLIMYQTFLTHFMQASDPGRIVLIYIVMKTSQKLMAKTALAKLQIGIEVARLN